MADHPALISGNSAVITGGASGIGLAAAKRFAALGMHVAIADINQDALDAAAAEIAALAPGGSDSVLTVKIDVSRKEEVERLKATAYAAFGEVDVLMNNAGRGKGGGPFENYEGWQQVIGTNLWGVINGVHVFAPAMIAQNKPGAIINTGSKQGITCPPGDTAYNVSKAGVKVLTEGLAHTLRNTPDCEITAHLLVPGWTFTGLTARDGGEKPAGAWTADQVIDFMFEGVGKGDFYLICPDNDVTREVDNKRIQWAANDIVENRPPLSRWHPEYEAAFADFLRS